MKGELKVLIVFAAFEGTLQSANGDWHIFAGQDVPDESNNWGLPTWVEYENGEISIDKFLFDDPDDFDTNDPNSPMNDPENLSISKSLYLMSNGAFKLMGVPFYDEQGEPLMVMPDMTT